MSDLDQEIMAAVSAQKTEIVAGLIKATADAVRQEIGWKIREAVANEIGKWIESECLPEVAKQLAEKRVEIIQQMHTAITECFKLAGEAAIKKCTDNLARGYHMDQLVKGMFG